MLHHAFWQAPLKQNLGVCKTASPQNDQQVLDTSADQDHGVDLLSGNLVQI